MGNISQSLVSCVVVSYSCSQIYTIYKLKHAQNQMVHEADLQRIQHRYSLMISRAELNRKSIWPKTMYIQLYLLAM
jgi:hypothetical protein